MTFRQYFNHVILEKYISYQIPVDKYDPDTGKKLFGSKEKLMFDFYVLSFLSQYNLDDNIGPKKSGTGELMDSPTMRRELSPDMKQSFEDAKKTLLPFLRKSLLNAVLFAVCAEFRHIYAANSNKDILKFAEDRGMSDFIKKYTISFKSRSAGLNAFLKNRTKVNRERYKNDNRGYYDSYISVKNSGVDEKDFITFAGKAFEQLSWSRSYGGTPWANICNGWIRLYNARSESDLFVSIDHIYDLQHNTDTVFNKLDIYRKNGDFKWIKDALDYKRDIKDPRGLLDKCSGSIKMIALRVLKSEGYSGWDDFISPKKDEPKETQKSDEKLTPDDHKLLSQLQSTDQQKSDDVAPLIQKIATKIPSANRLLKINTAISSTDFVKNLALFMYKDFLPYFLSKQNYDWFTDELKNNLLNAKTLQEDASAVYAVYNAALSANTYDASDVAYYIYYGVSSAVTDQMVAANAANAANAAAKKDPSMIAYFVKGIRNILEQYPVHVPQQSGNLVEQMLTEIEEEVSGNPKFIKQLAKNVDPHTFIYDIQLSFITDTFCKNELKYPLTAYPEKLIQKISNTSSLPDIRKILAEYIAIMYSPAGERLLDSMNPKLTKNNPMTILKGILDALSHMPGYDAEFIKIVQDVLIDHSVKI